MKVSIFLLFVFACCFTAGKSTSNDFLKLAQTNPEEAFQQWTLHHNKDYINNETEYQIRKQIFLDNLNFINQQNLRNDLGHQSGLTAFADQTFEEFKSLGRPKGFQNLTELRSNQSEVLRGLESGEVPASIDWRDKGAVTPVKNQKNCGACWAFAATGAIEARNFNITGKLVSLSEQQLIDCDATNYGCDGGSPWYAFMWIVNQKGITTEKAFPYTVRQGVCDQEFFEDVQLVTIDSWSFVEPWDNEEILKAHTAIQPVSVGMDGYAPDFQFYSGGIYDGSCGFNLDHAVLIVGYGTTESGIDYWLVKNSWGTDWGEDGYFRLRRNIHDIRGKCGIAMVPSVPYKLTKNPPAPPVKPNKSLSANKKNRCDAFTSCPLDTLCCCVNRFGVCWRWSCCPLDKGTCCPQSGHCCPPQFPVCSEVYKTCVASTTHHNQQLLSASQNKHIEM